MENKIFLLGMGAQKAGTTWLYDYLKNHPNTDMGFAKEYHVFDALYVHEKNIVRMFLQDRINRAFNAKPKPIDIMLLRFIGRPNTYFEYFKTLVSKNPEKYLTGDITPVYSALNKDRLLDIRQALEKFGFKVKVIFLMRDPVERCISASRMQLRKSKVEVTLQAEIDHIKQNFDSEAYQIRARYDLTINNINSVFSSHEVHFAFYEELFTEESIQAICQFLEIPFTAPNFSHNPNKSRTSNPIPDSLKSEIAMFYKEVYEYSARKFGAEKIKRLWKHYKLISPS